MNAEKREARKQKKANWKAYKLSKKLERKEKRAQLKQEYADAPFLTRFFRLHGVKLLAVILVLAVLCLTADLGKELLVEGIEFYQGTLVYFRQNKLAKEPTAPAVYELSPYDEEGAERIDAIPSNDPGDTWTFCVYMVGADLEDAHENDLSAYTQMITSSAKAENQDNQSIARSEKMRRLIGEIEGNGLDMPNYLYKINKPIASSYVVTEDVVVASGMGCASTDIGEMSAEELPDNITIVIQTGGATRWSNTLVNPNRTQRFVLKNGILKEDMSLHIQDSCDPETLADFMEYCVDNYESDHMGLILWDHGSGVSGYGCDTIFGSSMSLADIHNALDTVFVNDPEDPYFDFIGFDACLMATTDTAVALEGYGQYLLASEEAEPGDGWDYTPWLRALAEDPGMSAAKVGRTIADTFIDSYVKINADPILRSAYGNFAVTFSVVDINKAAELDAVYEEMNKNLLKLVAEDTAVLTDMSQAATKAVKYGGDYYDYFNAIDLGDYVDYLSELYPEECAEVRQLLREAVVYNRASHYLRDSHGLSIYFPTTINEAYCLFVFTDYIYEISNKPCTNALYFYKVAGCLNDELQEVAIEAAGKPLEPLSTQIFYDYQKILPEIEDSSIIINVGDDLETRIQKATVEMAGYNEEDNSITYYGSDDCCYYDGEGNILTDVDGTWFALDGVFLDAEYSFGTATTSSYRTKVLHNKVPSYMTFTYDDETGAITIDSVVKIPEAGGLEYDAALKATTELHPGDTIAPIVRKQDASGQEMRDTSDKTIRYKRNSGISLVALPDGDYLHSIVITDLRGDDYFSPVVESTFEKGKAKDLFVNPAFVDTDN